MTIKIPKLVLIAGGILLVGVVAFLLGRNINQPTGTNAGQETASSGQANLDCSKQPAIQGVESFLRQQGEDGPELLNRSQGKLGAWVSSKVIGCADLDGDGLDEMVLTADAVKAGASHPVSWFLLKQDGTNWRVVLRRTVPVPRLSLEGSTLTESTPGYEPRASYSSPSYRRVGRIVPSEAGFSYHPQGIRNTSLKISLSPGSNLVNQIGPLEAQSAVPSDAIAAFGRPSFTSNLDRESCPMTWSDIGLEIFFANLGGLEACKFGRVGGFALQGSAARTSGWIGPRGLRIGMSLTQVAPRFPGISRWSSGYRAPGETKDWPGWLLLERPTPYGDGGYSPTLIGYFKGDRLRRLDFSVGAAGE